MYREHEESYRQKNAILNIEISDDDLHKFLRESYIWAIGDAVHF